jgi:RNA polymerase sigma-70 factor (ECF subfamily)
MIAELDRRRAAAAPALARLLPRLRRFGERLTRSTTEAEDLVQAACLRALARLDQLEAVARLDAWMYRIMRNLWTDECRAARRRAQESLDAWAEVATDEGERGIERRLALAEIREAVRALPEEQRAVLVLVCVDGLSYKQAASRLEIPVTTVTNRLHRARQTLHQRLAEPPPVRRRAAG